MRYMITALLWTFLGAVIAMEVARGSPAENSFIHMLEARFQVYPGAVKVWPDCQCTVRYNGTRVRGKHYEVSIDKLD